MHRNIVPFIILTLTTSVFADAKSDYEMLFGDEAKKVSATKSTADDAAFAKKLLDAAKALTDSPKTQVFLYEKVVQFGGKDATGAPHALEAIDILIKSQPAQKAKWEEAKLNVVEKQYQMSPGLTRKEAAKAYLDLLIETAEAKAAAGKANEAVELYRKGVPVATYARYKLSEIRDRMRDLVAAVGAQAECEKLIKKLAANPKDTKAREKLILIYVLERDDPAKAASLLADGVDEKLPECVPLAAKRPADLTEAACMKLGDWYKQLAAKASAKGKPTGLARAKIYYERYLSLHTKRDMVRYKASAALAEVNKELKKLGGVAPPRDAVPWAGHCYKRFDTPMSFTMAQRRCGEMGGHLVRIESDKEQQFVASLAKRGGFTLYWIDGSDEQKEGEWKFSSGQVMRFTAWGSGQPDDPTGRENKVHLVKSRGWRWNDAPPSRKCGFICEWDAKPARMRTGS